jgi:hypothetical protein
LDVTVTVGITLDWDDCTTVTSTPSDNGREEVENSEAGAASLSWYSIFDCSSSFINPLPCTNDNAS